MTDSSTDCSEMRQKGNDQLLRVPPQELPFWLGLATWSIFPGRFTPWFDLAGIPVNPKHLLLVPVALLYLVAWWPPRRACTAWHSHLPIVTIGLLTYMALSMSWSGMDVRNTRAMTYVTIINTSTFALGYLMVAERSAATIRAFLQRLTVLLAAIALLYTAENYFSLGLSEPDPGKALVFGIQRVRGPLYGAAQGGLLLLPALGFALHEAATQRQRRLLFIACAMVLVIAALGSGSRSATLQLGCFSVLLFLFVPGRRQRLVSGVMIAVLVAVGAAFVFSRASAGRLMELEDLERGATHVTAFRIIQNAPMEKQVFGSGHGSLWPWYLPDVEFGGARATGQFYIYTPYGLVLHAAHSVLLLMAVELGAIGLLYLAYLWAVLGRQVLLNLREAPYPIVACGLFTGAMTMFTDYVLFRAGTQVQLIFWIYLFGLLALRAHGRMHSVAEENPDDPTQTAQAPTHARSDADDSQSATPRTFG